MTNFIHLHNHTEYSVLDGACKIDDMLEKAIEYNMPAVAITDHGNMFGCIEFYQKAKKKGINPIIGCECYIAPQSRFDKKTDSGSMKESSYHLTLLAKNLAGYKNLLKLVTAGHLEGFYYKPRIDKELLEKHHEGLICLSGCLKGEASYGVANKQSDSQIRGIIDFYHKLFKDDFYLEVHNHGIPEENLVKDYFKKIGKELNIKLVAANDCHYMNKDDARVHDILLCIQTGNNLSDEKRMKFSGDEFYFKSPAEMAELFSDIPEAIQNTIEIAEKCNLELTFNNNLLPNYPMEDPKKSREDYFRELCYQGLQERYPAITQDIKERLEFEINMIKKMGFISYFLITWDFINYARTQNIPVGPGRGSAAGSIVSYCLGITNLDPLKYDLFFERFLNPDRISMPDIDIDFCMDRRSEVIDYVYKKYSNNNVAQIITFGRMKSKGVIRDVARVLGVPYSDADKIAKLIPDELNISLKDSLKKEPALQEMYDKDETVKDIFNICFRIEGMVRNVSTHAAGVVISETPLTEYVPLYRASNGEIATQYEMKWLEKIGLLKMDFLGLKTLTVIHDAVKIIKRSQKQDINLDKLPLDEEKTYKLLKEGQSIGIFQLESSGMQDLLRNSDPSKFTEIIDLIALYRPGPMEWIPSYIERKLGKAEIKYDHPLLKPILENSFGIMIYQEQVMQCANVLANFTMAQADTLRKIMGKKIVEKMQEQRILFVEGAKQNNIEPKQAEHIFDVMANFAKYGFNKSHSTAYAIVSYQTAYLKANYPVEFMAALLSNELNNQDKITKYILEAKEMGIEILPPDINESFANFSVVGKTIRFGLAAIKNVGTTAVDSIIEQRRKDGNFKTIYDFIERVDSRVVNKKVLESLIKCGAFDSFKLFRSQLFKSVDALISEGQRLKKEKESNQISLFSMMAEAETDKMTKDIIPQQNKETWTDAEKLFFEKELLGFYVTGHPLGEYHSWIKKYSLDTIADALNAKTEKELKIGGIIVSLKITITKSKSEKMAILKIEDETDNIEALVFPRSYKKWAEYIEKDAPVLINGKVDTAGDMPKIIVSKIQPIAALKEETPSKIIINVSDYSFNEEKLKSLNETIQSAKGDCKVTLRLSSSMGNIIGIDIGSIDPTAEMIKKIENCTDEKSLTLAFC